MVCYDARLLSRNCHGLVTFYIQLITNYILKQLIFDLSNFPHLLLNLSIYIIPISLNIFKLLVIFYGSLEL